MATACGTPGTISLVKGSFNWSPWFQWSLEAGFRVFKVTQLLHRMVKGGISDSSTFQKMSEHIFADDEPTQLFITNNHLFLFIILSLIYVWLFVFYYGFLFQWIEL